MFKRMQLNAGDISGYSGKESGQSQTAKRLWVLGRRRV